MLKKEFHFKQTPEKLKIKHYESFESHQSKSKITLPPIYTKLKPSSFFFEDNWKLVGASSPMPKQNSDNFLLRKRKTNVVLNLKRQMRNPQAYISNDCPDELNFEMLEARCRKLTMKFLDDI